MTTSAWILGLHLLTHHDAAAPPNVRTDTPGVYAIAPSGATVGAFRNSLGRGAGYVGWTFKDDRLALTVGAIRYSRSKGALVAPLLMPSVGLGAGFRATYVARSRYSSSAVHLSWEVEL